MDYLTPLPFFSFFFNSCPTTHAIIKISNPRQKCNNVQRSAHFSYSSICHPMNTKTTPDPLYVRKIEKYCHSPTDIVHYQQTWASLYLFAHCNCHDEKCLDEWGTMIDAGHPWTTTVPTCLQHVNEALIASQCYPRSTKWTPGRLSIDLKQIQSIRQVLKS